MQLHDSKLLSPPEDCAHTCHTTNVT